MDLHFKRVRSTRSRNRPYRAGVPVAKLSMMMGTSIGQIEDTYHGFLRGDEERYGSALDSYGKAAAL